MKDLIRRHMLRGKLTVFRQLALLGSTAAGGAARLGGAHFRARHQKRALRTRRGGCGDQPDTLDHLVQRYDFHKKCESRTGGSSFGGRGGDAAAEGSEEPRVAVSGGGDGKVPGIGRAGRGWRAAEAHGEGSGDVRGRRG